MAAKKRVALNLPLPLPPQHQRVGLPLPLPLPLPPQPNLKTTIQSLSELERAGVLGHGRGGTVYKVLHSKPSSYYALKLIRLGHGIFLTKHIINEMEILRKADSPYVVKCHGIFQEGGDINFVLEHMDGGSLSSLLTQKRRLSESLLAKIAGQVLEGLKYLHSQRIVHRDIKPSSLD